MTANGEAISNFLRTGAPGSRLEYHRGFIARDLGELTRGEGAKRERLIHAKREAWFAYEQGTVELVQKRHDNGDYSYFMIKRRERVRPVLRT